MGFFSGVSTWQLLLLVMGRGLDQYWVGHLPLFFFALMGSENNPFTLKRLYLWYCRQFSVMKQICWLEIIERSLVGTYGQDCELS